VPELVAEFPAAAQFGVAVALAVGPPPQPVITVIPAAVITSISSPRKSRRRATGSSSTQSPASASPATRTFVVPFAAPVALPHVLPSEFPPVCDEIVTVALALGAAVLNTSVAGLTAQPGRSAADPSAATVQVSDTVPVNPFAAVANTVTAFPLVAPAFTLSAPGVDPIEKLPGAFEEDELALGAPDVIAAAIRFAPSTDPHPVDWSNPIPTSNPASPPVSPADDGVLLLHIDGIETLQPETPAVDSVTS
jgi:hypothetical protein